MPSDTTKTYDVLIVGSGPVGTIFARKLVDAGFGVCVCEAGAALSSTPGEHLKNAFRYQRDVNSFTNVIRGSLQPLSVPTNETYDPTLDPSVETSVGTMEFGQNPRQKAKLNLPGAAATYAVGGMGTHWTCAIPRLEGKQCFSNFIPKDEMTTLYEKAEELLMLNKHPFEETMLQETIKGALRKHYTGLPTSHEPQDLPLAVTYKKPFIFWTGSSDILGKNVRENKEKFTLKPQHLVERLLVLDGKIKAAEVKNLISQETFSIKAKMFVVACGAVLTPQLLYNSSMSERLPALGKYLCEQPLAFCQIVLKKSILEDMKKNEVWSDLINEHRREHPNDRISIPPNVPFPQCWIPYSDSKNNNRPWHCQVTRDAFSYGDTPRTVDNRIIVDLRWFGKVTPKVTNFVKFEHDMKDMYGMPKPTFEFEIPEEDKEEQSKMMTDMVQAALSMGGFLKGSRPQFMEPGTALHITGTVRMGDDKKDSVVDRNSKVHGIDNLFLGSNGVIPTGIAANPTLTSCALAIKSCDHIISLLRALQTPST